MTGLQLARRGTMAGRGAPGLSPYATEVMADGPVLYMPFNEATVAPVDATGNHAPTVPLGGVSSIADGPLGGRAYQFNGSPDVRVEVADSAFLDVGDVFSLECLYRPIFITGGRALMGKGDGAFAMFRIDGNLRLTKTNIADICTSTGVAVTDTGHWYHIVMTKNGAAVKIWIDGVDRTGTITNATMVNNSSAFGVAVALHGVDWLLENNMDMAHVAVYPTALSAARVAAHFAAVT